MMHYIVVHVNADKNPTVVQQFGIRSLPSYVITNSAQVNLKSGKGFKRPIDFEKWLNEPSLFQQN